MTQVRLRNINLSYNGQSVLKDIDLTIGAGEFCVFIGPSGCGKSSLLRLIAGLEPISSGSIEIDGVAVNEVPPAQRNLAMVFQSYALYPHMTVFENMAFGLTRQKLDKAEIRRRVAEASRILQLDGLLERKPGALSGGQRQRVAIGRAIVKKPKVFLFDEPLSNLDASLRGQTRMEIARLHRELGSASMIYVTHDQIEAMTLANKIVLLRPGAAALGLASIAQVGSPLELYHHPANLFAAGFIGTPAMNFIPSRVEAIGADGVTAHVKGIPCLAHVSSAGLGVGEAVTLGIRPEHIEVGAGPWSGAVTHVESLGEHGYIHLSLDDSLPVIQAKIGQQPIAAGDRVAFSLPPAALHLFDAAGVARRRTGVP